MSSALTVFSILITVALTIAGMVLLYLKVIPKKHDGSFSNKFLQGIHDYFNFKKLYIESILKFLFTLLTVVCIAVGVSTIVYSFLNVFSGLGYIIDYGMAFVEHLLSAFFIRIFTGILIILVGPIIIRLIYEGIMMFIILVKNVIEINNKTKKSDENSAE